MQKPQNKQFFSTLFLNKKLQVYPTWKTKSTNVLLLANSTAPHNPQLWGSLYLLFMGVQHLVVGYAPCFIVYNAFNTCRLEESCSGLCWLETYQGTHCIILQTRLIEQLSVVRISLDVVAEFSSHTDHRVHVEFPRR